ncbi:hypothetical protein [Ammoniphilus sp. 3BR4]|uniref:hypothetical protein n=1 Tax=Ammoniphilus sp. 3BR4 TaxID=3158265 RepID=UPI00346614BA
MTFIIRNGLVSSRMEDKEMSVPKDRLYQLIDALPEAETDTAASYLEFLLNQSKNQQREELKRSLEAAPYDDQPVTDEDAKDIADARKEIENGETFTLDEVRRKLGLCGLGVKSNREHLSIREGTRLILT